jgi:hypothetical protein
MEFVQTVFYGNTLTTWILAATVALVVFAASSFTKRLIRRYLDVLARRTATNVDDIIAVGDLAGTVEYVCLKTTRVRSLSGEQLVFSNSDLLPPGSATTSACRNGASPSPSA